MRTDGEEDGGGLGRMGKKGDDGRGGQQGLTSEK